MSERAREAVLPRRSSKGWRLVMTGMAGPGVDDDDGELVEQDAAKGVLL